MQFVPNADTKIPISVTMTKLVKFSTCVSTVKFYYLIEADGHVQIAAVMHSFILNFVLGMLKPFIFHNR